MTVDRPRILGVTPARGGSKGLPGKNIRPLAGRPLLAWTIAAARECPRLDRYVVSTEDPAIAAVARAEGAEVLDRPAALAADDTSTLDVLRHALEKMPADVVVLLQATSPVRRVGRVAEAIDRFEKTNADSLASGFLCTYTEYGTNALPRQKVPGFFYDDGNLYVMRGDGLARGDRYGVRRERFVLDREERIDIDDEFDFWMAEQILRGGRGGPWVRPSPPGAR